jgi:hypothetical protein
MAVPFRATDIAGNKTEFGHLNDAMFKSFK